MINFQANDALWVDKYQPQTTEELAVDTAKIKEVENWINKKSNISSPPPVLLLMGPLGAGKTATLRAIPNLNLCSWNGDVEDFRNFLLNSSQIVETDATESVRKIILVESLPNRFYEEPNILHSILVLYRNDRRYPLVIIVSDRDGAQYSVDNIIPHWLRNMLNIRKISFDAIAVTQTRTVIETIISRERGEEMSEDQVRKLAMQVCACGNGDLRSAINRAQLMLTTDIVRATSIKAAIIQQLRDAKMSEHRSRAISGELCNCTNINEPVID